MQSIPMTAAIPAEIGTGLQNGTLSRFGTVIRRAAGQPGAGEIMKHLREVIPRSALKRGALTFAQPAMLQHATSQLLALSQVAAAASVMNLGVSVVGFAVMNHKLNRLQESVDAVASELRDFRDDTSERLDRIEHHLVEIRYLQQLGLDTLADVQRVLQDIRYDVFAEKYATLSSRLRELGEDGTVDLRDARRDLERVRLWLEQTIATPSARDAAWSDVLMRYRLWCMASTAEVHTLRRLGTNAEASDLAAASAGQASRWAKSWTDVLLPSEPWGGVFVARSPVARDRISVEILPRLARLQLDRDVPPLELHRLTDESSLRIAGAQRSLPQGFDHRVVGAVTLLDFVAETTERLQSSALEMRICRERRIGFYDWEGVRSDATVAELQFMEMAA